MFEIEKDGFTIIQGADGKLYVETENIKIKFRAVLNFLTALGVPINKDKLKTIIELSAKPVAIPEVPTSALKSKTKPVKKDILYFVLDDDESIELRKMHEDEISFDVVDKKYFEKEHCIHEDYSLQPYINRGVLTEEQAEQISTIMLDDYGIDIDSSESVAEIFDIHKIIPKTKCKTIYELCDYINSHESFPFDIVCIKSTDLWTDDEEGLLTSKIIPVTTLLGTKKAKPTWDTTVKLRPGDHIIMHTGYNPIIFGDTEAWGVGLVQEIDKRGQYSLRWINEDGEEREGCAWIPREWLEKTTADLDYKNVHEPRGIKDIADTDEIIASCKKIVDTMKKGEK